jgi:Peptidase family M48
MTAPLLSLIVSLAAFAAVIGAMRICLQPLQRAALAGARAGRVRPDDLLLLRLAPVLIALLVVSLLVLPAFLLFEPRGRNEIAGLPILALAALGAAFVATAIWRAGAALWATRVVTREWLGRAKPLDHPGLRMPAFVVDVPYPLVAATGIIRQRLFVSECVLRVCGEAELDAIFAHEAGHVAAADNLWRLLIRACPDTLRWNATGRALERAWCAAAEEAADGFALDRGVEGVDLAASLVAVARAGQAPALGAIASAFLEGDDVARRVRRALGTVVHGDSAAWTRLVRSAAAMLILVIVAAAVAPGSLAGIHSMIELGVGFLR